MRTFIQILFAGICVVAGGQLFAQKKNPDAYFEHLVQHKKFMGSVSIFHNDKSFYSKSAGYIDVNSKTPINADTKFRIGSLSKTFTAVLILQAIEEKLLKTADKLSKYYPEVKNADKITIEHLLKHRSGVYNFTETDGSAEWEEHYRTDKEIFDLFVNKPGNFEPGTDYEYSNSNYALLGFILHKIYGKTYGELLNEKIVQPLQLKNTYYSSETDTSKNEAYSYNIQNTYNRNATVNFSSSAASGGIASTSTDVNKFLYALFNGKLINAESLQLMLSENDGEYGFGIERLQLGDHIVYTHDGRIENYISVYWYFPKDNLGIVTLASAININLSQIQMALLRYAYGTVPELPDFDNISDMPKDEFAKIKGTYFMEDKSSSITISSDGQTMVFQDSRKGQDYVFFKYEGNNTFKYADITLTFYPEKNEVLLEQGIYKVLYTK